MTSKTATKTSPKPRQRRTSVKPAVPVAVREDFAQVDPTLFGLSLFTPFQKGTRKQTVEVAEQVGDEKITVTSAYRLGAEDLSILLGILAIAGQETRGKVLRPAEKEAHRAIIEQHLQAVGEALAAEHVSIETTIAELLEYAGLTDAGRNFEHTADKLHRLRGVYYSRERIRGNVRERLSGASENLLFYRVTEDGALKITLCDRLSRAILGKPFKMVWLPDFRALRGSVARILFVRLSVIVRPGDTVSLTYDRLVDLVYDETPNGLSGQQMKDRRRALREAIAEINELPSWDALADWRGPLTHFTRRRSYGGRIITPKGQMGMDLA